MKKKYLTTFSFIVISFLAIGLAYRSLTRIFFLNDEWVFLGKFLIDGMFSHIKDVPLIKILAGESRVIGLFFNGFIFYYFPFNGVPFAVVFMIMHWINGILVYILSVKLTRRHWMAFCIGLFFVLASAASQTLSWIAAGNQILVSTFFSLLSFLSMTMIGKKYRWIWIGGSVCLSYFSFLTKPNIFFLSLPFLFLCVSPDGFRTVRNKKYLLLFLAFLCLAFFGFSSYFGSIALADIFHSSWLEKGLFNSFYYPLISIAHYFIPFRYLFRMAEWFTHIEYGFMVHDGNIESIEHAIVSDLISLFFSLVFVGSAIFAYFKSKEKEMKVMLFAGILYVLTIVPVAFYYPDRGITFIGSRHLYFGAFPIAVCVIYIVERILFLLSGKWKKVSCCVAVLVFVVFIGKQISIIQREVYDTVLVSEDIKRAFFGIKNMDTVPANPVFFVTSDRTYYYPDNPLPFQVGNGYMIALARYQTGKIPKEILENAYLSKLNEEGYVQKDEKGFGFYWNQNRFFDDYCKGSFKKEQIIGIHFKESRIFENTTASILKSLSEVCDR